jgi:hypothetical protein
MDPFAALGAAAAITSLVQLGVSLVREAHDIYHSVSGLSEKYEQVELNAKGLSKLAKAAVSQKLDSNQSDMENALKGVAERCQTISEKILDIVQHVKPKNSKSVSQSALSALKHKWYDSQRKELEDAAEDCQRLLHSYMTLVMGFVQATQERVNILLMRT